MTNKLMDRLPSDLDRALPDGYGAVRISRRTLTKLKMLSAAYNRPIIEVIGMLVDQAFTDCKFESNKGVARKLKGILERAIRGKE